ncbi:hypothetical protein PLICRDRAFT_39900 [Plicaturopsis crispa FD-325 SS-3]|nr:hypothetical protein PLICRDRAFT_39900 [Plicaturopsis crispa FD-325 SS-3]
MSRTRSEHRNAPILLLTALITPHYARLTQRFDPVKTKATSRRYPCAPSLKAMLLPSFSETGLNPSVTTQVDR